MLVAAGARVVIADMQEAKGQTLAQELGVTFMRCDVSQESDAKAVVERA
jgi:NAD(P)-dependent dehydrogenase (short-subunit alcohol dehydrogenase family)